MARSQNNRICEELKAKGIESEVTKKTGLLLDPYFSATKIAWILDNVKSFQKSYYKTNNLLFGTVDTFLIWKLTKGNSI